MRSYFKPACYWLSVALIAISAFALWLIDPWDINAWRVRFNAPVIGSFQINAAEAIQLATSGPGRFLLTFVQLRTRFGTLAVRSRDDSLQIDCQPCWLHAPEFGRSPIRFDRLSLSLQRNGRELSGKLILINANNEISVPYTAKVNKTGVAVDWSLPKTPINIFVNLLKENSAVLQQVQVNGSLSATGTLQLPSLIWTAKPELQGFTVSGLATERLKTAHITYRCTVSLKVNKTRKNYPWLNLNQMGRWLPRAVIIAEDAHFREHPGYNLDAIRSILSQTGKHKQLGGSTLTQQLAKNFFTGGGRTWLRKLEELLYAVEMEGTLGKKRILELYLNTVDLGPGICGAGQAAQVYFDKQPAQLKPVEAAWLASIIRNPHRAWKEQYAARNPDHNRVAWVMSFMPKSSRLSRVDLAFQACCSATAGLH